MIQHAFAAPPVVCGSVITTVRSARIHSVKRVLAAGALRSARIVEAISAMITWMVVRVARAQECTATDMELVAVAETNLRAEMTIASFSKA